jgi:hypothetical protein
VVALLDLEDIIVVVGRAPNDAAEAAQWQYQIDAVSAYINSYVSVSFELIEGDVVRYEADYYGIIDLGGDPIISVNSVVGWQSQSAVSHYWNGLDEIRGLCPNEVVEVDFDHGYATVPEDIKYVATQAVVGVLDLGATGSLTSFTVGDVTEVYSNPEKDGVTAVTLERAVLDKYSDTLGSWRLGSSYSTGGSTLPTM